MLFLTRQGCRLAQIKEIAEASQIPQNYLELLLTQLKKAGLVESVRGTKGGYKMGKNAEKITVLEVLRTMESEISSPEKYGGSPALLDFWGDVNRQVESILSVSLQEIADRDECLANAGNYVI
jgi:Rrf2 family protein